MKNTTNNLIFYSLVLLAFMMLGATVIALMPKEAKAATFGTYQGYNEPIEEEVEENPVPHLSSINPNPLFRNSDTKTITIYGEEFVPGAVVKINGSDRNTTVVSSTQIKAELIYSDTAYVSEHAVTVYNPGKGKRSNTYTLRVIEKVVTSVSPVKTTTTNTASTVKKTTTTSTVSKNSIDDKDFSGLAAGAIFGGNSFMPSGIVQWLLLAIFILLIVIIVRKIFGEKQYHQSPLKHA